MRLATPFCAALSLVLALPLTAGLARAQHAVSSDAPSFATAVDQTSIGAKTSTEHASGTATASFGQGGPDAFGYTWIDSDEPGGPTFVWNDISATGTAVVLGDDQSQVVTLPFSFSFYGANQTSIRIGSNGFVAFGGTANTFTNAPIPTAAEPNNMVAGFWDDLNPADGGTIHYQAGAGTFTVQYTNVPRFADPASTVTFQVVLNQDGTIRTYYNAMVGVTNSATIGLENATGTVGLQVVFNNTYVHNGLAILFQSLPPPTASVTPGSLTFNLAPGGSSSQNVTVANTAAPGSSNLLFNATVLGNAATSITHSASMDVLAGSGVACPGGDNFLYRVFDLTAMGVTEPLTVTSIDFGIETSTPRPSTVTLYTLSGPFVVANLTQVAQVPFAITGQVLEVVNVPISHTFAPTDIMVVEWAYDNTGGGGTFFGGNPAGQTGPTYVRSAFCAVPEPTDLAAIGFPDSHWAMTVNAAGAPPVVTATGTSGAVAPGASAQIAVTADATGLTPGVYNFSLEVATNDPANPSVSVPITVNVVGTASPGDPTAQASLRVLPNPMNTSGTVEVTVPTSQDVRVAVYDMLGREVMVLMEGSMAATQRALISMVSGRLDSGVYVVRAIGESFELIQRVTVTR